MLRNGLRQSAPSPAASAACRASGDSHCWLSAYRAVGPVRYAFSASAPAWSAARSVSEFFTTLKRASASRRFERSSAACCTDMPL